MDVVIVGGHGKAARRPARLLAARGDRVRGVIRNPAHEDDLRADGSEPVVCDLERAGADELAGAISGADAVVFAAGSGPGSGAERKLTVDRDGAIKLLHAARAADVERYVMVSSIGAENPATTPVARASVGAPGASASPLCAAAVSLLRVMAADDDQEEGPCRHLKT